MARMVARIKIAMVREKCRISRDAPHFMGMQIFRFVLIFVWVVGAVVAHGVENHAREEDLDSRSAQIQVLYHYLRDHDGRSLDSFERLAKESPAEIKAELHDIILLKKKYYHCDEYDSVVLQRAVGVLAALYGHEAPIYHDLLTLVRASQEAPSVLRAKGDLRPSPDSLILDQMVRGYLEGNRSPEALGQFLDILKSGLLRESGHGAGSKENAYFLLSRRYAEEVDPLVRDELHDVISERLECEVNVGAKSKFVLYLENVNFPLNGARLVQLGDSTDGSGGRGVKYWYESGFFLFTFGGVLFGLIWICILRRKKSASV